MEGHRCPVSMRPAKWRAPACTARIGWPATRCSKAWSTGRAPRRACANNWDRQLNTRPVPFRRLQLASGNGRAAELEKFIQKVQTLMWDRVGVVRDGKILQQVVPELRALQAQAPPLSDRRSHEAANILQAGLLIARSALAREESRGAHYRLDHPLKNDAKYHKHSVISGDNIRFE